MKGLSLVFAYANHDGKKIIGDKDGLLWHSKEDLRLFKSITMGVGSHRPHAPRAMVMGRKTWDSLPIKPLPNRINVILSRQKNFMTAAKDNVHHFTVLQEAMLHAQERSWALSVIGGAEIFREAYGLADVIFATRLLGTGFFTRAPDQPCYLDLPYENDFTVVAEKSLTGKIPLLVQEWHRKGVVRPMRLPAIIA